MVVHESSKHWIKNLKFFCLNWSHSFIAGTVHNRPISIYTSLWITYMEYKQNKLMNFQIKYQYFTYICHCIVYKVCIIYTCSIIELNSICKLFCILESGFAFGFGGPCRHEWFGFFWWEPVFRGGMAKCQRRRGRAHEADAWHAGLQWKETCSDQIYTPTPTTKTTRDQWGSAALWSVCIVLALKSLC